MSRVTIPRSMEFRLNSQQLQAADRIQLGIPIANRHSQTEYQYAPSAMTTMIAAGFVVIATVCHVRAIWIAYHAVSGAAA